MRFSNCDDRSEYYDYMLLYIDAFLCIYQHNENASESLGKYLKLKPGWFLPLKIYLGGKLSQVQLTNGVNAYSVSGSKYTQETVKNVEGYTINNRMSLRKGTNPLLTNHYIPECDIKRRSNNTKSSYYASLIGILRSRVEMGRLEISCKVYMMSSYVVISI